MSGRKQKHSYFLSIDLIILQCFQFRVFDKFFVFFEVGFEKPKHIIKKHGRRSQKT